MPPVRASLPFTTGHELTIDVELAATRVGFADTPTGRVTTASRELTVLATIRLSNGGNGSFFAITSGQLFV